MKFFMTNMACLMMITAASAAVAISWSAKPTNKVKATQQKLVSDTASSSLTEDRSVLR